MLRLNLTNRDNTMNGTRKLVIRTRQIGDVFQQGGRSYEVVEVEPCNECRGCGMKIGTIDDPCIADIEACGLCYKSMRSDNKSVIFKKIEHEEA